MTETGWPLIPRETLPAPVPAAKNRPARAEPEPPRTDERQLSIFGAETTEPSPADLAGLLAGPGQIGRMGGTARVSVPVDAAWRVHVLVAELVRRGLVVSWQIIDQDHPEIRDVTPPVRSEAIDAPENPLGQSPPSNPPIRAAQFDPDADPPPAEFEFDPDADPIPIDPDPTDPDPAVAAHPDPADPARADPDPAVAALDVIDGDEPADEPAKPRFEVRTAYSSRLNGLALTWPDAAAQLFLSGPRLRLWVAAAGEPAAEGYALGLDPGKDPVSIDAALVRAGLSGQISDDGRRYVITGRRRLARLAELVGERPSAAPAELWPGGAGA
jgi:hypothetical protein